MRRQRYNVYDLKWNVIKTSIAGVAIVKKKESPDSEPELNSEMRDCRPTASLSSSYAETTDASESSVTNSPNVRATKSKGKKGKKKKR